MSYLFFTYTKSRSVLGFDWQKMSTEEKRFVNKLKVKKKMIYSYKYVCIAHFKE